MMNNKIKTNKIHILDQHTANQIAAGEVVERPFSVVKELVENSVDANATKIAVTVFDTQLEKIQVSDNGYGMSPEEMRLAVLRHATSKINQVSDLDGLATLGFRGEALPSIAAVSQMKLVSKQKGAADGYSMQIIEGKATIPEVAAAKTGTTITIDRLFYNTPARKKFLKTPRTEMGLISELISQYIVAYPHIAFRLLNGKHLVFNSSGKGDPTVAFFEAYGKNLAEEMISFDFGYLSPPQLNRSSRSNYHFFVNGRPIKSKELNKAVDEAYFNFLPEGRYPIVFIFLDLAADSIDVNVHPGKLEIKFHSFGQIRDSLITSIRSTIGRSEASAPHLDKSSFSGGAMLRSQSPGSGAESPSQEGQTYRESNMAWGEDLYQALHQAVAEHKLDPGRSVISPQQTSIESIIQEKVLDLEPSIARQDQLSYASLTPLGQFAGTFIICSGGDYLYIIDQHAAAERVLYEKIAAAANDDPSASSGLAVPIAVELSYQEALQLTDAMLQLREFGFIVEHFGDNSFIIRGVPVWYSGTDPEQLLRLFLDEMKEEKLNLNRLRKDELFMAACKQAIKANRHLTNTDMVRLLDDLDHCENAATCPHGRPLAVRLSLDEIYKRFLRGSI